MAEESKPSIFDKLTDPNLYTGSHKNRFDSDGKGKGIDGRTDRVEADGYVDGFKKTDKQRKTLGKKEATVVSRLTDPKLYTGAHKNRFDAETGKGKGIDARVDRVDADGYVDGFKKNKDKLVKEKEKTGGVTTAAPKKKSDIFDRLTDPKLYTGSHKTRFDAEGKGLGVNQVVDKEAIHDLSSITRPEFRTPSKSPAATSRSGSTTPSKTTPRSSSSTPTKGAKSTPKKKSDGSPSIFDKLTDPKLYTGTHKNRFDDEGNGKGKAGRVDLVEADGYVQGYKG